MIAIISFIISNFILDDPHISSRDISKTDIDTSWQVYFFASVLFVLPSLPVSLRTWKIWIIFTIFKKCRKVVYSLSYSSKIEICSLLRHRGRTKYSACLNFEKKMKTSLKILGLLTLWCSIEIINNKARHNLFDAKYRQMAFPSAR